MTEKNKKVEVKSSFKTNNHRLKISNIWPIENNFLGTIVNTKHDDNIFIGQNIYFIIYV